MTQVIKYDGSFQGLLSAVFDIYERRFSDVRFTGRFSTVDSLFGIIHHSHTEHYKWQRVWKGMQNRISRGALQQVYRAFLSEQEGIEEVILNYIRYVLSGKPLAEHDYSHPSVLKIQQVAKIVYREKHRMEAFVRFHLTLDQLYYAIVEPDFDVLPLISKHFSTRYADQRWLIYDSRRKYGIHYNLRDVSFVTMDFTDGVVQGSEKEAIYDEREPMYQRLWQIYFNNINIAARKNIKLHLAHMPKRYWRFLPEKLGG